MKRSLRKNLPLHSRTESRISAKITTNGSDNRSDRSGTNLGETSDPRPEVNHRATESLADMRLDEDLSSESGESFYSVRSTLPSQRRPPPVQQVQFAE